MGESGKSLAQKKTDTVWDREGISSIHSIEKWVKNIALCFSSITNPPKQKWKQKHLLTRKKSLCEERKYQLGNINN